MAGTLRSFITDPHLLSRLDVLESEMEKFLGYWQAHAPHFTDHGKQHCEGIEAFIGELLPNEVKNELDEYEIFLLICGILTHDIGMMHGQEGKTNEEIRENHHIYSKQIITNPKLFSINLNDNERFVVGELAFAHRDRVELKNIMENIPLQYEGPGITPRTVKVRLRFLAGLLRLGDACDITHSRTVDESIADIIKFDPEAKIYHDCHRRITGILSNQKDCVIEVHARVMSDNEEKILENIVVGQLRKELASVKDILIKYDGKYLDIVFKPIHIAGSRQDELRVPPRILATIKQRFALDEWVEELSWNRLFELCHKQCHRLLETMKIDKYNSELYEPRRTIERKISDFLASEKSLFLLIGNSGIGKTNLLCRLAENYLEEGYAVLFYSGGMVPGSDFMPLIRKDLKVNLETEQILEMAGKLVKENNKDLIILLDGLNENRDPETLLRNINDMIGRFETARIKVVVSCRTTIWEWLRSTIGVDLFWNRIYGAEKEKEIFLDQFGSLELPKVYNRYKAEYNLQTHYEELSDKTKEKLKVPLMLKFVSKIYRNKKIPKHTPSALVFQEYYRNFIFDPDRKTGDINKRLFLEGVVDEIYRKKTDRLPLSELWEHKRLGPDMREIDLGSNFIKLRDEGIVYIDHEHNELKFTYDQFFEFLLGRLIIGKKPSVQDYLTFANESREYHSLWGGLTSALIMHWDPVLLEELARSNDYRASWLVRDALVGMAAEEKAKSYEVLHKFMKSRSVALRRIAVDAAYDLKDSALLEQASTDNSTRIRAAAIQYMYYLWKTSPEKIFETLERLSKKLKGKLGLPTRWLEPFIELSLIIYAEQFRDEQHFRDRKENMDRLRRMWKKVLDEVLYLKKGRFPVTGGIRARARDVAIGMAVRLALRGMRLQPSYCAFNLGEVKDFTKLSGSIKEKLVGLTPYIAPERRNIEDVVPEILALAPLNNCVFAVMSSYILLVHSKNNRDKVIHLIKRVFQETRGAYPGLPDWMLISIFERQPQAVGAIYGLCEKMAKKVFDTYKGSYESNIGRKYISTLLCTYAFLHLNYYGESRIPLIEKYLTKAIKDSNAEFLFRILYNLKLLATSLGYCSEALSLLKPLLRAELGDNLNRILSETLASIRALYPREVELFLEQKGISPELRERVRELPVQEQIGEVHTETIGRFFGRAVYFSPLLRRHIPECLAALARYDNVTDWMKKDLARRAINLIHGENVLSIDKSLNRK